MSLAPYLSWQTVHPNFLPVAVIALSLLKPFTQAMGWAFVAGVMLDVFSGAPFGVFTVSMLIVAAAANFWYDRFTPSVIILPVALALPYSLLFDVVSLIIQQILGRPFAWSGTLLQLIFSVALMNIPVMLVLYPLFHRLNRPTSSQEFTL